MVARRNIELFMKNIFKKYIVLLSLGFVLFGLNVTAEEIPASILPECIAPQILNETRDACIDVIIEESEPLVCILPQILNEIGDACIDPIPEATVCTEPQILIDGVCADPVVEPTPDPIPENTIQDIIVKNECTVKDTEGIDYIFPEENSTSEFLGICALVSAKELGYINEFELINDPNFGLYLSSINGEVPSSTEYWALFLNNEYASCGIGCLPVSVNDILSFVLSDWMAGTESTKISFRVSSLEDITPDPVPEDTSSGGGGGNTPTEKSFSVPSAISFLSSQQKSDGSFGELLYTDWVAIAISRGDNSVLKSSIENYLRNNSINSSIITDYERHAMALMALGINPYSDTEVNYIKKITDSFDGTQIGDISLFNDDIFGIIVLQNAGYDENDEIIIDTISNVISKQSENGSWGSVDMTSAGIMALKDFEDVDGVSDAISKAENYLVESQNEDGGFDNSASTSWAIQALSLNNSYGDKVNDAIEYLANKQQDDGGVDGDGLENRVWNTSYAIPAVLSKSWKDIMQSFEKPAITKNNNSSSDTLESSSLQKTDDLVFCPKGDLFSTVTGKPCTDVIESDINVIDNIIPDNNPNLIKKVIKSNNVQVTNPINQEEEISPNNNLGASAGNIDLVKTPAVKKIFKAVTNSVIDMFTFVGKGFLDLINIFTK